MRDEEAFKAMYKQCEELSAMVLNRIGCERDDLECPRAQSNMTPCIAKDGGCAMANNGQCVGCSHYVSDLLEKERAMHAKQEEA